MNFNEHLKLTGTHALFTASNYHWINYTDEKLEKRFSTVMAARRGTELHAYASEAVRLRRRQPEDGDAICQYINDAIGFRMTPEQVLFYSYNFYGTADAISFRNNQLRIHDLKTGIIKSSMHQLYIYAALFCLEYRIKPHEIETFLRIYQNNEVTAVEGDPDYIVHIMDRIVTFDKRVEELRQEEIG